MKRTDHDPSNGDTGSDGYQIDSAGYPPDEKKGVPPGDERAARRRESLPEGEDPDPTRFMDPKEFARSGMISASQPIAHQGMAGWAFELATRKAIWLEGKTQWDVLERDLGAPRDEPGLTDIPEHGGLPEAGLGADGAGAARSEVRRRTVQLGLRLTPQEGAELERAAELFGTRRTALARMLVVRGAREIVGRAPESCE